VVNIPSRSLLHVQVQALRWQRCETAEYSIFFPWLGNADLLHLLLTAAATAAVDQVPVLQQEADIDYLVRSTSKDLPFLLIMLSSAEKFLDRRRMANFFVVYDQESEDDHQAAALLPPWVTVVFEQAPPIPFPNVLGAGMHEADNIAGWTRSQWSNFHSDKYGRAPFLAILDTDIVFKGFCSEQLSFFDSEGNPRIFCTQHRDLGMKLTRTIDPAFKELHPWSCMESFPFMFRRSDLPAFRAWLAERMQVDDFDTAFSKLLQHKDYGPLAIGQFAMLGSWAYIYAKSQYAWAIGGQGELSTCPELRMGHHVPYARLNYRKKPKLDTTYFNEAARVVFEGDCWAQAACASGGLSPECAAVVDKGRHNVTHSELLSLEGTNEMMFGGATGRPLKLPKCSQHVDKLYEAYHSCLVTNKCSSWWTA
jgi:hypothetical protein